MSRLPRLRMARPYGLLLLALAACGPRGADRDVVELRFWAMGREGEVVRELLPAFEREHPGIRVRVQQIPWGAAHEKMLTAFVGESVPDLSQMGNTWVPEFAALNALEPLGPYMARFGVPDSSFFPGILATNVIDGQTLGLPWYVDTRLVFYRKDVLDQAGIARFPETWAAWTTALRAMQRQGLRYGLILPTVEWNVPILMGLQNGAPLLKDGGRRGAFSDPRFLEAYHVYVGMIKSGLSPENVATLIPNVYEGFAGRMFGMYVTGPWQLGEFKNRLPDSLQAAWATAPMPGPDGPGVSLAGGSSLVLFRKAPHKEEAAQLLAYLMRPDVQLAFFRLTGSLPARRETWRDTSLTTDPRLAAFGTQLERVVPTPLVPEWERIAQTFVQYNEMAVRGTLSEQEAMRRLDADVDRILEKRRWMLDREKLSMVNGQSSMANGGTRSGSALPCIPIDH